MTRIARLVVYMLAIGLSAGPLATTASAQDTSILDIHGFGGWAAGYTGNDNRYMYVASEDLEVNNYYFTLNLVARPADKISIHAQPTWQSSLRSKELSIDLVYAEWNLARNFSFRAGKIKNPLGIYTEIYKVGTLRPFYLLPAMYRNVPESYAGAGVNHVQRMGEWELELDALAGHMEFEPAVTDMAVGFNAETKRPIYASIDVDWEGRDFIGGGALLRLPVKGLEAGLAAYSLEVFAGAAGQPLKSLGDERTKAYMATLEYVTEHVSLRTEGFMARGVTDFDTGYVEAAYKFGDHWQIAAQYDFHLRKDPPAIVKELGDHQSIGAALNYWVNSRMVWKLNYYHVTGNHFARVDNAVIPALAGTLEKETDVLMAGAHFSF